MIKETYNYKLLKKVNKESLKEVEEGCCCTENDCNPKKKEEEAAKAPAEAAEATAAAALKDILEPDILDEIELAEEPGGPASSE